MRKLIATMSIAASTLVVGPAWIAPALAQTGAQGTGMQGMSAGAAGSDQPGAAQRHADFVHKASASDQAEMQSSQLALQRAQDPAVKMFARWMITDHTMSTAQLKTIAQSANLQMSTAPDAQQQQMLHQLQAANGAQFDQQYVAGQVQAHQQAVQLFQQVAQSAGDDPFRTFAQMMLPAMQAHLQAAQDLQGTLGGTGTASAGGTSGSTGTAVNTGPGMGTSPTSGMGTAPSPTHK